MIQYFPIVTGSLTVSGSLLVSGGITASGGISISGSIASASYASTASFVALAQSASNAVSAQTASFANTFTVAGNLTAQTLVVQTITSSVDFVTGSTRFGSIAANTHVFTGSVSMNPGGLFVSSSGLVGIGTTTPDQLLTIIGSGSAIASKISTVSNHASFFEASSNNSAVTVRLQSQTSPFVGTLTNTTFDIVAGGNIAIRTTGSGNVGIGTTTVNSRLSVFEPTGLTTSTAEFATQGNAIKGRLGMFANNFYITSNWFYNGTQNADNTSIGQNSIVFSNGLTEFQTSAAGSTSPTTRMTISSIGDIISSNTPFYSVAGGPTNISNSYVNIFTAASNSSYILSVRTTAGDGTYGVFSILNEDVGGGGDKVVVKLNGNNISCTMSGNSVALKCDNVSTYNMVWAAIRIM